MPDNPLQQLEPKAISFRALAEAKFPGLTRGNLIGTRKAGNFVSDGIDWAQEQILGHDATVSHIMRYLGRGLVIDQQSTLELRSLQNYTNHLVRSYCWPGYSLAQRNSLCIESLIQLQDYAWLVIVAHAGEAVLGIDGLAEKVARDGENDCSQGAYKIERLEMPNFMGGEHRVPMPAEIDDYCIRAGWEIRTWLLTE